MVPDPTNLEARQDRDRREQEELLLLLLLGLIAQSRNRADSALSLGADPFAAAADVLAGNAMLRMPPAWPRVARILRDADVSGYRRTVRVIGDPAEVDSYVPVTDHNAVARQAVARLLQYVQSAIADGIRRAAVNGGSVRRAVADSFVRAGLVESATSKAWYAETVVETVVGFAFAGGWFNGFARPDVAAQIKGWRFSATLDSRTTDICRVRHGVKLPTGHPWLARNTPALHFRCRSVLLPIFRDFTPTVVPPTVPPPMQGFGQAPAVIVPVRFAVA